MSKRTFSFEKVFSFEFQALHGDLRLLLWSFPPEAKYYRRLLNLDGSICQTLRPVSSRRDRLLRLYQLSPAPGVPSASALKRTFYSYLMNYSEVIPWWRITRNVLSVLSPVVNEWEADELKVGRGSRLMGQEQREEKPALAWTGAQLQHDLHSTQLNGCSPGHGCSSHQPPPQPCHTVISDLHIYLLLQNYARQDMWICMSLKHP